jgi:arsenate reductase
VNDAMPQVTIFHNPDCGTSRNTLALIRHAGIEPNVVEYLETPPSKALLRALAAAMGVPLRGLLREKEALCATLKLTDPPVPDEQLLDALEAHPVLINRPIVQTPLGTKLCRPGSEEVLEILPAALPSPFTKEDGQVVHDHGRRRARA